MKKMYSILTIFMVFFLFSGMIEATDDSGVKAGTMAEVLDGIADQIKTLVPVVALLMLVLGGLIYGIGQVMGAEVRGRAAVWAQALIIGAIIGLMISALATPLIDIFKDTALFEAPK